jgi:WD40 repeat protein
VERQLLEGTGRSAALAIDPQGTLLVTGGPSGTVRLWNPVTGEHLLDRTEHEADVTALAVAEGAEVFASGDERGRILLWRRGADGWSVDARLEGHSRQITGLRFTSDGARLVSSSGDRTVGQWDVATGRELRELVLKHPEWVAALDVSDDGRFAITACDDGVTRAWRLGDAREVARWSPPAAGDEEATVTTSVDLAPGPSPGNKLVALLATAATGTVDRWLIEPDAEGSEPQTIVKLAGAGALWSARFAADANTIVTVGGNDARVWRVSPSDAPGPPIATPVVRLSPHGAVADAAFSPDGSLVATGSWDHSAKLWDAASGSPVRKLDGGHNGFVNALAFSPDGAELATAGDDAVVRFWSVASGALAERKLAGHTGRVLSVVYSRDGRRLLSVSTDKTARLWDAATGAELRRFVGHEWGLLDGALSPDGARVATASDDNSARIWDVASGEELFALRGHSAAVAAVAFSPDGRRVLTGGEDNVAKVWDASTGKEVLTLTGHTAELTSASFSPDGRAALTGSRDGAAIVWPAADWR